MAGYVGPALPVAEIVSAPPHSLLLQSYQPREMQSGTVNADGYGAALWLDDGKPQPALYRTSAPIWADPNQQWMGERLRVRSVIAAVRSATPGIGFELANVQPFARGTLAFAHNGFIADFRRGARRQLCESLGAEAFEAIEGTSDSEHIFALVHDAKGTLGERVAAALRKLEQLDRTVIATLLLGDGEQLVGVRWARGGKPATLYLARWGGGVCLASEPLDPAHEWRALPEGEIVAVRP